MMALASTPYEKKLIVDFLELIMRHVMIVQPVQKFIKIQPSGNKELPFGHFSAKQTQFFGIEIRYLCHRYGLIFCDLSLRFFANDWHHRGMKFHVASEQTDGVTG